MLILVVFFLWCNDGSLVLFTADIETTASSTYHASEACESTPECQYTKVSLSVGETLFSWTSGSYQSKGEYFKFYRNMLHMLRKEKQENRFSFAQMHVKTTDSIGANRKRIMIVIHFCSCHTHLCKTY